MCGAVQQVTVTFVRQCCSACLARTQFCRYAPHVAFVTPQMVSASFAMEQAPARSATHTTGGCVLPTGSTKMWVDLADVLCYGAHLPLDRGRARRVCIHVDRY